MRKFHLFYTHRNFLCLKKKQTTVLHPNNIQLLDSSYTSNKIPSSSAVGGETR